MRDESSDSGAKVQKPHRKEYQGKRAIVACNQCRTYRVCHPYFLCSAFTMLELIPWKKKCRSDGLGTTCQNCVKFRRVCEYSNSIFLQNWLDHENASSGDLSGIEGGKLPTNHASTYDTMEGQLQAQPSTAASRSREERTMLETSESSGANRRDDQNGI